MRAGNRRKAAVTAAVCLLLPAAVSVWAVRASADAAQGGAFEPVAYVYPIQSAPPVQSELPESEPPKQSEPPELTLPPDVTLNWDIVGGWISDHWNDAPRDEEPRTHQPMFVREQDDTGCVSALPSGLPSGAAAALLAGMRRAGRSADSLPAGALPARRAMPAGAGGSRRTAALLLPF